MISVKVDERYRNQCSWEYYNSQKPNGVELWYGTPFHDETTAEPFEGHAVITVLDFTLNGIIANLPNAIIHLETSLGLPFHWETEFDCNSALAEGVEKLKAAFARQFRETVEYMRSNPETDWWNKKLILSKQGKYGFESGLASPIEILDIMSRRYLSTEGLSMFRSWQTKLAMITGKAPWNSLV